MISPISSSMAMVLAVVLGGLLAVAYILKMKRQQFEVPFAMLWRRVLEEKNDHNLWRHLKRFLSFLLLLVIVGFCLLAAMAPNWGSAQDDIRSIVIIVDTSASMKAMDETQIANASPISRLQAAKRYVITLLDSISDNDSVMLLRMDGQPSPLSRFQNNKEALKALLANVEATDTPADLRSALSTAADALRWRQNPQIIIVGDGAYPAEARASVRWPKKTTPGGTTEIAPFQQGIDDQHLNTVDLDGIKMNYQSVGQSNHNVGIVAFNVRRYIGNKLNYEVFIEIQNFSDDEVHRQVVLYNGDTEIDVRDLHIAPGKKHTQTYPNLGGGENRVLRARIESANDQQTDVFSLDDEAWALIPENKRQKILLVSDDNLYIEGALLIFEHLEVDKLSPSEYESNIASNRLDLYDAAIFHEYTPTSVPQESTHLVYFNPNGDNSPFTGQKPLQRGRITTVSPSHPVMRWIEMDDVNFDTLHTFTVDESQGEIALAKSLRATVAAAKTIGSRKIVAFGFSMTGTDLMLRVSFPLLIANTLDWFAGSDSDLIATYTTGHRAAVPMDNVDGQKEVKVLAPSARTYTAPIRDGYTNFFATEVGIHQLSTKPNTSGVAAIQLAANLSDPLESNINPTDDLELGGVTLASPSANDSTTHRSLWVYLVIATIFLLFIEWYTFHRRITV